jgi:hypothetical protein
LASISDVLSSLLPLFSLPESPNNHQDASPEHAHLYPILESEILHLANQVGSIHPFSSIIDITCVSYNVRSLQIGVSEVIHNSEDDKLMLVEETLLLVFHVMHRAKSYRRVPATFMVDPLSKDERKRPDGSEDMPVQSSRCLSTALVDCSDPAGSWAKTMTWRDVGDSLATQNFDADSVVFAPKTPDWSKISKCPHPNYPQYSPCFFEKSPPSRNSPANSMTEPTSKSKFSQLQFD